MWKNCWSYSHREKGWEEGLTSFSSHSFPLNSPMGLKATCWLPVYIDIPQEWFLYPPLPIYGKIRSVGSMWLLIQNTIDWAAYEQDKLIPVLKVLGVQGQGSGSFHFWQGLYFWFLDDNLFYSPGEGQQGRPSEPHLIHRGSVSLAPSLPQSLVS